MTSRGEIALPVDLKIIEQTLVDKCGCVAAAARDLGMPSGDLRRLVASRPLLANAIYEGVERAMDAAEKTLLDGLDNENPMTRIKAAAYFLRLSSAGRKFSRLGSGGSSRKATVEPQSDTTRSLD